MLDHLVDILVHPNPETRALLEELMHPTLGSFGGTQRIADLAGCAVKANVSQAAVLKITAAAAKAEGWEVAPPAIQHLVGFIYKTHRKQQDEAIRAKQAEFAAS